MAWILPAFVVAAASLWRKQAFGYKLAGVMLSHFVLLILAVVSMAVFEIWDGHLDVVPQMVIFGTLFASGLGMLTWLLTGLRSPRTSQR